MGFVFSFPSWFPWVLHSCPGVRHFDVGTVELRCAWTPEELQRTCVVVLENFDRTGHAWTASGAEPIGVGAADQHSPGAEAHGLRDVAAATDAAVHQDLRLSPHGRDH